MTADAQLTPKTKGEPITHHWELEVYQLAMQAAVDIFKLPKKFPAEEKFALTSQVRASSRSVTAQLAEGWRKRRYEAAFAAKLNDAEGEAAETQSWLEHSVKCEYVDRASAAKLFHSYDRILGKLVTMQNNPAPWLLRQPHQR